MNPNGTKELIQKSDLSINEKLENMAYHLIGDGSKFLVDLKKVDEIITVSTEDAKERARSLALNDGLLVGISSGANILAAERWVENNNPNGIVFTILCDRGERYSSMLY